MTPLSLTSRTAPISLMRITINPLVTLKPQQCEILVIYSNNPNYPNNPHNPHNPNNPDNPNHPNNLKF
jgi:hypothetical protein